VSDLPVERRKRGVRGDGNVPPSRLDHLPEELYESFYFGIVY
jgi:hypothetical protein